MSRTITLKKTDRRVVLRPVDGTTLTIPRETERRLILKHTGTQGPVGITAAEFNSQEW